KSYSVSDQAIQVSAIAEGGKLAPDMENRIFLAAVYPDGSPAPNTEIKIWHKKLPDAAHPWMGRGFGPRGGMPPPAVVDKGKDAPKPKEEKLGDPIAVVKTNSAGLAEIKLTPKNDQFRVGGWGNINIEMVGGNQQPFGPQAVLDLRIDAK